MEDDVNFMLIDRGKKGIEDIIKETPLEADFLHLFNYKRIEEGYHKNKADSGAVCYVVFEKGYKKLMKKLYSVGRWNFNEDLPTRDIVMDGGIRKLYTHYKYFPSLIIQSLEGNSTHDGKSNEHKLYRKMYRENLSYYV